MCMRVISDRPVRLNSLANDKIMSLNGLVKKKKLLAPYRIRQAAFAPRNFFSASKVPLIYCKIIN